VVDYEKDAASMNAKVRNKHDGLPPLIVRIDPQLEKSRLVCQLGTSDPDSALQAALRIYRDVSAVDVNMGCPKKFSTSGGMGSALLSDPQRAASIIRKLDSHLPVPISAKIRLLPGPPVATVEFASALIDAGASAVAIHGRRVGDLDVHDSDRDALKQVASVLVQKFPSVPICANGDFYTRSEFQSFRDETLASAVLLARPALYNASIFIKPGNHVNGNRNGGPPSTTTSSSSSSLFGYDSPLLLDRTRVVQEYVREAVQYQMHYKNVKYVVCEMLNLRRTPSSRVHALTHRDVQQQQHSSFPISSSSLSPRLPFQRRPFVNSSSAAATNDGTTTTSSSSWMRPTIAQTCACKTLEEICDLWEVSSSFFSDVIDGDREDGYREDGCGRSAPDDDIRTSPHGGVKNQDELRRPARCVAHQQSHHPAGEHTYLDSYILQNAVESAAAAAVIVTSSSSSAPSTSSARRDQNSDDCEGKTSPDGTTLLNPKKPRVEED
jgi:tRNA-dihydrouridine synthase 2